MFWPLDINSPFDINFLDIGLKIASTALALNMPFVYNVAIDRLDIVLGGPDQLGNGSNRNLVILESGAN